MIFCEVVNVISFRQVIHGRHAGIIINRKVKFKLQLWGKIEEDDSHNKLNGNR